MRNVTYRCDCCWKEINGFVVRVMLPIIVEIDGKTSIRQNGKEMDFCEDCGRKLSEWYYKECEKHGSTGMRAINMNDDWEEF